MTQTSEPTAAHDPITAAVAPGYAFESAALELGGLMLNAMRTPASEVARGMFKAGRR
jgi:hypothetical protein